MSHDTSFESGCVLAAKQRIYAAFIKHKITAAEVLGVGPESIEFVALCTPLQEGMIADGFKRHTSAYFTTFKFALADLLDVKRLQRLKH